MKPTPTEMMKNLQGINSRTDEAENKNNDLEYQEEKTLNQNSKQKNPKNEDSCKEPLIHNCITMVPEGEEKDQESETLFLNNDRKIP